jgi:hypothetical protein
MRMVFPFRIRHLHGVIAGVEPATHPFVKILKDADGTAGQARG